MKNPQTTYQIVWIIFTVMHTLIILTLGWYGPRTNHPHNKNAEKRMKTQMENLNTLGIASRIAMNSTCRNNDPLALMYVCITYYNYSDTGISYFII